MTMAADVPSYSLGEIVENGLCMGCGICRSVLGGDAIEVVVESDGLSRPRTRRALSAPEIETLNALCPGVNVSAPEPAPAIPRDPMWGDIARIAKGHAGDPISRFRGASGGALTALAIYLLESGKVDMVLHLAADRERPMLSKPHRSYNRDDVRRGAGSRYSAAAPLLEIAEALAENRRFAFIGKPCDITALGNLARRDRRVDELCRYKLTMFCGGFSELAKFRELLAQWHVAESELARFSFRGHGCPGPTAADTKDGRRFETTYWDLWSDESTWRSLYRCKICPDAIGLSADLVALDVWDDGNPTREDDGWNGLIARNDRGRILLEEAVAAGAIILDAEWTTADLDRAQPHQARKRRAARARIEAMQAAGAPFPRTEDKGLDTVSFAPDSDLFAQEKAGTARRLARGAHRRR